MIKQFLFFAVISMMICSCKSEVKGPNIEGISDELEIVRYEKLLSDIDSLNFNQQMNQLFEQYPDFSDLYFSRIMPFVNEEGQLDSSVLRSFLLDKRIKKLIDTTGIVYNDFSDQEKKLKLAAQYLRYYFPKYEVPRFYTLISEYGYQNFIFNDGNKDGIGIGLDMFLGREYPYKNLDPSNPSFSDYLTRTYNRENVVRKSFDPIVQDLIGEANGKRMIDLMIHEGKKLYILEKLLPFEKDTIIMEYTKNQMDWVKNNELEIWSYFLDKNLLYETSLMKTNRYVNPAPTSVGMPAEAPGRTAVYIGKKIVDKYMDRFPDKGLEDLISENDSQKLLTESKYKPKRK